MKRFFLLIVLKHRSIYPLYALCILFTGCNKGGGDTVPPPPPGPISFSTVRINGIASGLTYFNINRSPVIKFSFSTAVGRSSVNSSINFRDKSGTPVPYSTSYEDGDNTVVIQPTIALEYLTRYQLSISTTLQSSTGGNLQSPVDLTFTTQIDSSRKFPLIS